MTFPGRRLTVFGNYGANDSLSMPLYARLLMDMARNAGFDSAVHRCAPAILARLPMGSNRLRKLAGDIDRFAIAPCLLPRADVLHIADHANAIYLAAARARFTIVTCHDLIPFLCLLGELGGWRPSHRGTVVLHHIAKGLKRADHIVCVSENTRADLVRLIGIPPARISVIANCLRTDLVRPEPAEALAALAALGIPAEAPIVLSFAGSFYKNRYGTLEMFAKAAARLPPGATLLSLGPADALFLDRARTLGCGDRTIVPKRLSAMQLAALYANASVLLFPSLYEGFGYPVIEAQSFGVPVIASRAGPIPDVAGDGAILIDPYDSEAGAEALVSVLNDEGVRAGLAERGRRNVARFGFEEWRDAYRALYARLLAAA